MSRPIKKAPQEKPLLTKTQSASLRKIARNDPQGAYKKMAAMVTVERGIRQFGNIDAIKATSSRKTPRRVVGSVDQEFSNFSDRNTMIATARDLETNLSICRGLINVDVNNVVGAGPVLQMRTDDPEYNARTEKFFKHWSLAPNCDIRGILDFGNFIRLTRRRTVVDGDMATVFARGGKLQGIEGDRIDNPPRKGKRSKTFKLVFGIEVDKVAKPHAYHFWDRGRSRGMRKYSGRRVAKDVVHAFDPERFDQNRGVSALLSAINDMQDVREVLNATKGTMKLENILGIFTATALPQSATADPMGLLTQYAATNAEGNDEQREEVQIGQGVFTMNGEPGEEVKTIEKHTPGKQFEPFMLLQIRMACLALDMPLEIGFMYYTRGSFSSLKGAIGQYHATVRRKRTHLESQVCDRILQWKISAAIARGELEPPKKAETDRWAHTWQWPQLPLLEPGKEIEADSKAYNLKTTTLSNINAKRGAFWEDTIRQQAREVKRIEEIAQEEGVDPALLMPRTSLPGEPEPPDPGAGKEPDDEDGDED